MSVPSKYQVLGARDLYDLEQGVNQLIEEGWVPTGGITEIRSNYMQAMVKNDPPSRWEGGPR